jgi:hypothetical protein
MYKIVELPISIIPKKRREILHIRFKEVPFFHIRISCKEPLTIIFALVTMFIISKTDLICFDFMPISGWIISKVAKI